MIEHDTLPALTSRRALALFAALWVVLLGLAALSDRTLATMAAQIAPGPKRTWQIVTDFGTSGYMFGLSALIGLTALWAQKTVWGRAHRVRLKLVAEQSLYFFAAIGVSGLAVQALKHLHWTRPPQTPCRGWAFPLRALLDEERAGKLSLRAHNNGVRRCGGT